MQKTWQRFVRSVVEQEATKRLLLLLVQQQIAQIKALPSFLHKFLLKNEVSIHFHSFPS